MITKALNECKDILGKHFSLNSRIQHAFWMCNEAMKFTDEGKANRWLGFIQGVMHCELDISIEDLKKINKS